MKFEEALDWNLFGVARHHLLRPLDEVFHVRAIFMAALVLTPREFAIQQSGVHGRLSVDRGPAAAHAHVAGTGEEASHRASG